MKAKQVAGGSSVTYVVILDEGEEAFCVLSDWAARHQVPAGQVTAVGAFERATVGWFDRAARDYRRIEVGQQCEVLPLSPPMRSDPSPFCSASASASLTYSAGSWSTGVTPVTFRAS
jgi:predicted DNA-binding protein with PD1-like motif